jgi:RNA polymerase sigma-70 factor, ECF subfamily
MSRFATLALGSEAWDHQAAQGEAVLDQSRELNRFLVEVERRAFRMAQIALRNADDALDVVQDSMLKLAQSYGARPPAEWRPLFFRILQNGIRDLQRRHAVRRRFAAWIPGLKDDPHEEASNPIDNVADPALSATSQLMQDEAMRQLEKSLADLPNRQREAFMLRNFEGLDVAETAVAMGCSEGSVKTHYSRAVHCLREQLGPIWE